MAMDGSYNMSKLNFTLHRIPDPVLRQVAAPVVAVDARVADIMEAMVSAMYCHRGIGLAANQVGILERIVVIDLSEERDGTQALCMANPVVVWHSEELFTYCEGCLSIPEQYADVTRPRQIRVQYLDRDNKQQELEAADLLSQDIQHEIDHLNGKLFFDYLSPLKRSIMKRKVAKALAAKE